MKKTGSFVVLLLLLLINIQCTDDEAVEASVYDAKAFVSESGEEGADGIDTKKDE